MKSINFTDEEKNLIVHEMNRILNHRKFPKRGKIPKILTYVVSNTIENNVKNIKGYSIMVDVIGKDSEMAERALRVQMSRLRDAVRRVYSDNNDLYNTKIIMKPHCYVPEFEFQNDKEFSSIEDAINNKTSKNKSQSNFYNQITFFLIFLCLIVYIYTILK